MTEFEKLEQHGSWRASVTQSMTHENKMSKLSISLPSLLYQNLFIWKWIMPLLTVTTEMPPVNNQNFGKLPSLLALPLQHNINTSLQRCHCTGAWSYRLKRCWRRCSRLVYGCKQIPTWSLHCKIRYNSCTSARRVYSHKSQITARVCWRQIYSNFEMPILLLRNHCSILLPDPFLTKTPMDAKASKRHAHLVKLVDGHDHKPQLFSFLWSNILPLDRCWHYLCI